MSGLIVGSFHVNKYFLNGNVLPVLKSMLTECHIVVTYENHAPIHILKELQESKELREQKANIHGIFGAYIPGMTQKGDMFLAPDKFGSKSTFESLGLEGKKLATFYDVDELKSPYKCHEGVCIYYNNSKVELVDHLNQVNGRQITSFETPTFSFNCIGDREARGLFKEFRLVSDPNQRFRVLAVRFRRGQSILDENLRKWEYNTVFYDLLQNDKSLPHIFVADSLNNGPNHEECYRKVHDSFLRNPKPILDSLGLTRDDTTGVVMDNEKHEFGLEYFLLDQKTNLFEDIERDNICVASTGGKPTEERLMVNLTLDTTYECSFVDQADMIWYFAHHREGMKNIEREYIGNEFEFKKSTLMDKDIKVPEFAQDLKYLMFSNGKALNSILSMVLRQLKTSGTCTVLETDNPAYYNNYFANSPPIAATFEFE